MEPAGRQVGLILRRIRNKDKSKPEDRSATEAKSPEKADKIRRGDDGVTIRARQPSQGGSSAPLRPVRRRNNTTNYTGKRRRLAKTAAFSPPSTCTRPTPVRGKQQNKSLSGFVYSAAAARAAESSNVRARASRTRKPTADCRRHRLP